MSPKSTQIHAAKFCHHPESWWRRDEFLNLNKSLNSIFPVNSLEDVESSNNHPDMFLDRGLTPPTQIVKMLENSYCSDQLCGVTSMNNQMDPNGHFENFWRKINIFSMSYIKRCRMIWQSYSYKFKGRGWSCVGGNPKKRLETFVILWFQLWRHWWRHHYD